MSTFPGIAPVSMTILGLNLVGDGPRVENSARERSPDERSDFRPGGRNRCAGPDAKALPRYRRGWWSSSIRAQGGKFRARPMGSR